MLNTIKYYSPAVLWAGLIAFLSLTNAHNLPKIDWDLLAPDKLGHFSVYAVLNICLIFAVLNTRKIKSNAYYIYTTISTTTYGVLMEYLQFYITPDRQFEYPDMAANVFGALIGCFISYFFLKKAHNQ